jgi:hypothetical protein
MGLLFIPFVAKAATPTPVSTSTPQPHLTINSSGIHDCKGQPSIQGVTINASNVTLQNCDISTQANEPGVLINADNVTVQKNYIHELCQGGIVVNSGVTGTQIRNNRIWRASMAGITLQGTNGLVDSNEIWDTVQHPQRQGGIYSGCTDLNGADADGIRYFGSGHTISNNYIHDIANDWGSKRNHNPHTDCFQTWGPAANITVTDNSCLWAGTTGHEYCEHEGLNGKTTSNISFDHNLFANGTNGCMFETSTSGGIAFTNNTFVNTLTESVLIKSTLGGNSITNNIFYDDDLTGRDGVGCAEGATTISNNDWYNENGAYGTYCSIATSRLNPQFVAPGSFTNPSTFQTGNYHLQATSPVSGLGYTR